MKKILMAGLLAVLALSAVRCSKVPAGNVGVKFYLLGGSKGVDTEELSPGRYWIGINEELYLFPTFTQNHTWNQENKEYLVFQTKEGTNVEVDAGISYAVDPHKVTALFQKYRKGIDEITDIYLRNMIRDALVEAGSNRTIEEVYGSGKSALLADVEKRVRDQADPMGIRLEHFYFTGPPRFPQNVVASINAKVQATQIAQQRENEVQAATAEAAKVVAQAKGAAEAVVLAAKAEAEAIKIKGDALRENPRLIELSAIEKWDGVLPKFSTGGAVPFINVPGDK